MTIPMSGMSSKDIQKEKEEEVKAYKEAFEYFDWNRSGTIPTSVSKVLLAEDIALLVPSCLNIRIFNMQ